jgi:hypothetical protein
MAHLAGRTLDPMAMYRLDRCDILPGPGLEAPLAARLRYCREHVIRIYGASKVLTPPPKQAFFPVGPEGFPSSPPLPGKEAGGEPYLHTNACGDFTLLAREAWLALRGYPELPLRAFKLDGLLCYAAHYAGFRERLLASPMEVYHLEHGARGDGADIALAPQPKSQAGLLKFTHYPQAIDMMRHYRSPVLFNGHPDWGLADCSLSEWNAGE